LGTKKGRVALGVPGFLLQLPYWPVSEGGDGGLGLRAADGRSYL